MFSPQAPTMREISNLWHSHHYAELLCHSKYALEDVTFQVYATRAMKAVLVPNNLYNKLPFDPAKWSCVISKSLTRDTQVLLQVNNSQWSLLTL